MPSPDTLNIEREGSEFIPGDLSSCWVPAATVQGRSALSRISPSGSPQFLKLIRAAHLLPFLPREGFSVVCTQEPRPMKHLEDMNGEGVASLTRCPHANAL